jgi:hypothetical protein
MKFLRITLIVLSIALLCSIATGDLQAQKKWKPAEIQLQNCSIVALDYLASTEDAMAYLHDGYTLADPSLGGLVPEGMVAVLVHIIQCENYRIGDDFDTGPGTLYHEILLGGVLSPEGDYLWWSFPYTMTNPLAREAMQHAGAKARPARDLWTEVELDVAAGTASAVAYVDNLKPFGPDLVSTFEGPVTPASIWVADELLAEYTAFGSGVRGVTWSAVEDAQWYTVEDVPLTEVEGDFSLPVLQMHAFAPFGGGAQVMTGLNAVVGSLE